MDYVNHFNLTDRPFKNTYDGKYFYRSPAVGAAFAAIRDQGCPTLIHIKGRPKVGKTSVLRRLPVELRDTFKVALILNPHMTLAEMLRQALVDFGHSHKFNAHTREEELLGYFQNSVTDFLNEGYRLLIAVDNAEELSPTGLAELYGLMELEPGWRGLVYLLLCGSSEEPWPVVPDIMLETRELGLSPLSPEETQEYVQTRLKAAGGTMRFSRSAVRALWEYGEGLPETINQLAERGLISAWSGGRGEVGPAQLKAARASLDNPLAINYQAIDQASRTQAQLGRPGRAEGLSRLKLLAVIMSVVILIAVGGHFLGYKPDPELTAGLGGEPILAEPPDEDEDDEPVATATPSADNGTGDGLTVAAPSLPTQPPQLLSLPQGSLALVVNQDNSTGRLWQGGARGVGWKVELATPIFRNSGLYIFGRPRAQNQNPLIFQYPPSRNVPRDESRILWPRVETLLPQNILPVIVARGTDFNRPRNQELEETISNRVKAWVQSQQYGFPDSTADLYASSFQFFELGQPARVINRDDFRAALKSEAVTSGEVNLTTSQPLLMQDPGQSNLVWAVFNLKYSSKLRNDLGIRVLIFEKSLLGQDNWPIVAELWLPERSLSGE